MSSATRVSVQHYEVNDRNLVEQIGSKAARTTIEHNDAKPFTSAVTTITLSTSTRERAKHVLSSSSHHSNASRSRQVSEKQRKGVNTSTRKKSGSSAEAGSPIIPRRTSSINLKSKQGRETKPDLITLHRQSCQLFTSLDGTLGRSHNSTTIDEHSFSPSTLMRSQSNATHSASRPSISDDSPLGYTLARKRSSLPKTDAKHETRPTLPARDSYVSYRSSFLSSFPEPPCSTTIPPLPTQGHQRTTSKYHVFPQGQQTVPPLPAIPSPRQTRPPIVTTHSYTSIPVVDSEVYTHNPTSTTSISWTSPETRQAEYAKIDRAQCSGRRLLRAFAPRWLCGSLGGERAGFYDDDDDKRSVRRFRIESDVGQNEPGTDGLGGKSPSHRKGSSSTSELLNEKYEIGDQKESRSKPKGRLWCF